MSNPDERQPGKLCVGEELTKVTIVQELSRTMEFLKRFGSAEQAYFYGLCSAGRVQVAHVSLSLRGDDSIIWVGKFDR